MNDKTTDWTVNAYFNTRWQAMADGYRPGDVLAASMLNPITFTLPDEPHLSTATKALERIFRLMNGDERTNGRTERSLSVGDVCHVVGVGWFACQIVGWERMRRPHPSGEELLGPQDHRKLYADHLRNRVQ